VDGEKEQLSRIMKMFHNFFRAVSVMNINVHDSTPLAHQAFIGYCVQRSSCDIIENAKPA
jgi:hypothetical protein